MSEEACELVSGLYERWARGDLRGGGALDPDIEYARIGPSGAGLAGEYRGIDQLTRALDFRTGDIWTVRNGKATRLETYWDRAEAVQVAGLSG